MKSRIENSRAALDDKFVTKTQGSLACLKPVYCFHWSYGTIFALVGICLSSQAPFNCKLHLQKKEFKFSCPLPEAHYILSLCGQLKLPKILKHLGYCYFNYLIVLKFIYNVYISVDIIKWCKNNSYAWFMFALLHLEAYIVTYSTLLVMY